MFLVDEIIARSPSHVLFKLHSNHIGVHGDGDADTNAYHKFGHIDHQIASATPLKIWELKIFEYTHMKPSTCMEVDYRKDLS